MSNISNSYSINVHDYLNQEGGDFGVDDGESSPQQCSKAITQNEMELVARHEWER